MQENNASKPGYATMLKDPEKLSILNRVFGEAPPCFSSMQGKVVDFDPGEHFTVSFPVLDSYLNPAGSMQGGFISAAFDNVFGPLCWIASGKPSGVMSEMNAAYHRPIFKGDALAIRACVKVQGRRKVHMLADAFNNENKLIASASATYLLLA